MLPSVTCTDPRLWCCCYCLMLLLLLVLIWTTKEKEERMESSDITLLPILKTKKEHQSWYTRSNGGVVVINRREWTNAKGTISKCSLASVLIFFVYLFLSFLCCFSLLITYFVIFLKRNNMEMKKRSAFISKARNIARKKKQAW